MKIEKSVVGRLPMPYAVSSFVVDGAPCVVCATEDHGPVLWIAPPYEQARELVSGPGGCMSLVADPENPPDLFAIMGCFPGYQFREAGIYRLTRSASRSWSAFRVADLPFAHRMELVRQGTHRFLFAANLAQDKTSPQDWERPGSLWVTDPSAGRGTWKLTPVMEGIHRNHGLLRCRLLGRDSLLLSGAEGLFSIDLESDGPWRSRRVLEREVSEIAVFDLDGDGVEELATIEPFHGDRLRVYHRDGRTGSAWRAAAEAELSFGHGMLATTLAGRRCLLVSNRSGSRDLVSFELRGSGELVPTVIDQGCAAANLLALSTPGRDLLFATNQAAGEIARYVVSD
ncbi:MAG TPA: hypothetical protein VFH83_00715 [Spirochaetia bacterium]|nr:hypothetical protein [Spirochaetia bacterium]